MLATRPSSTFERVPTARAPADLRHLRRAGARPKGFLIHPGQSSRFAQGSQARLKWPARSPYSGHVGLLPGLNRRREPWQTLLVMTRLATWSTTFSEVLLSGRSGLKRPLLCVA